MGVKKIHGLALFASFCILLGDIVQWVPIEFELVYQLPLGLTLRLVFSDIAFAVLLTVLGLIFLRQWSFRVTVLILALFAVCFLSLGFTLSWLISPFPFDDDWMALVFRALIAAVLSTGLYSVLRLGWRVMRKSPSPHLG